MFSLVLILLAAKPHWSHEQAVKIGKGDGKRKPQPEKASHHQVWEVVLKLDGCDPCCGIRISALT